MVGGREGGALLGAFPLLLITPCANSTPVATWPELDAPDSSISFGINTVSTSLSRYYYYYYGMGWCSRPLNHSHGL